MSDGPRFPREPGEYRPARERLLEAEIELRRSIESVAAARRRLPPGGEVPEDYAFECLDRDGAPSEVRLSGLFGPDRDSLIVYSFMYGPEMERPCPSCTSIVDSLDGAAPHVSRRAGLVVVASSPLERILEFGEERDWRRVRLLSSAPNTYNRDYLAEADDGSQLPMLNVFRRENGKVRHFWGSELLYATRDAGQEPRHVDSIWPLWSLLDVTPEGRGGDWGPALEYG